jgi:diguanylate cyclase (GGDEF)-like protein/PAS domain S-box-containing protein
MKIHFWHRKRVLLMVAVMVVVGLFLVTRSVNVEQHTLHTNAMLQMKELDARLDRDVMQVTSFLLNHYDSLAQTADEIRQVSTTLRDPEYGFYSYTEPTVDQAITTYLEALEQKLVILERIKFQAAVLRNGLQYLPTVAEELHQYDGKVEDQVVDLLQWLYRYNLFHSGEERKRIADEIDRLDAASVTHPHRQLLENIFMHMRANLKNLTQLARLKDRFLEIPATQRYAELTAAYGDYHAANVRQAGWLSLFLMISTVLLLSLLGWVLHHLDTTRGVAQNAWSRLRDAVESVNEAFALFDSENRLVLYNRKWREFYPWLKGTLTPDSTLLQIREANAEKIQYELMEMGAHLEERVLEQREESYIEHLENGHWYLASDNETSEGGRACVRVDITQSKKIELELRKLSRALEQSPASVVITNTEGIIEYVNPKFEEISGYSADEVLGQNPRILKSGDKKPGEYKELWDTISAGREWKGVFHNKRKDGSIYWEAASISGLRGDDGRITHYIAVKEDITARKRAEDQLRMNATVFDTASEGILVTDANNRVKTVNPAFTRITGYEPEDIIGQDPKMLSSGRHDADFYRQMWSQIDSRGYWSGEVWNRRKDGNVYPEWISIVVIRDEKTGEISEYVAVFSDISQRKQDEEQIRRQANFDALTGLPNRSLFFDRLHQAVIAARREESLLALLFVDLDRFKAVNDTFGHVMGDELLQEVAERLSTCVRDSDTVARLGGDEFVVLVHDLGEVNDAALVADKIIEQMSTPFEVAGREVALGASIGITVYPEDTGDAEVMMRNADMAMYRAKEGGRNRYQFFTVGMQEQVRERLELEQDLRLALERDELILYYQPIVDSQSEAMRSVEALLRWDHPKHGFVPPDTFIPLAEEAGLIIPIGNWVIREACRQIKRWREQGVDINVSVNVSSRQRGKEFTPWTVSGMLKEYQVRPELLTLEITEGLLMDDSPEVINWLNGFRDLGIGLSIDDFGTGYSSLSYLKRFPVNIIKIDRAFVHGLPEDSGDASLVDAILAMGKSLGLKVVAEGVETKEQHHFLRKRKCEYLQGFYFGKPMPEQELRTWLQERDEAAEK